MTTSVLVSVVGTLVVMMIAGASRYWIRSWRLGFRSVKVIPSLVSAVYDEDPCLSDQALPYGDALALRDASSKWDRRRTPMEFRFARESDDPSTLLHGTDLVLIGGPKHNHGTFEAFRILGERMELAYQFARVRGLYPEEDHKVLVGLAEESAGRRDEFRNYTNENGLQVHVGTIVFAPNPFDRSKRLAVLAGMSAFSTMMSGQFLSSAYWGLRLFWWRLRYKGRFQLIFKATRINEFQGHIESVRAFAL